MELSVMERIVALELLPREGDFITLKALRELRESLAPNEKEVKKFGITATPNKEKGMIDYSWEKNGEADIPISEMKCSIIRDALKVKERNKHLTENEISLYEKFVVSKEEEDKKPK